MWTPICKNNSPLHASAIFWNMFLALSYITCVYPVKFGSKPTECIRKAAIKINGGSGPTGMDADSGVVRC